MVPLGPGGRGHSLVVVDLDIKLLSLHYVGVGDDEIELLVPYRVEVLLFRGCTLPLPIEVHYHFSAVSKNLFHTKGPKFQVSVNPDDRMNQVTTGSSKDGWGSNPICLTIL
ncbi:hypothetical protein AKJ16_DCAP06558 [Drosera capensis]